NRPLPPILASGVSRILSPRVVKVTSSTASPGLWRCNASLTNSACHRASGLLRVAMRIGGVDVAGVDMEGVDAGVDDGRADIRGPGAGGLQHQKSGLVEKGP